jgi:hypothetical protein
LTPFFKDSERKLAVVSTGSFSPKWSIATTSSFTGAPRCDQFDQRLLDANRIIGQPSKITTIFGRKVTKYYKGKLQTDIEDLDLPNPGMVASFFSGVITRWR